MRSSSYRLALSSLVALASSVKVPQTNSLFVARTMRIVALASLCVYLLVPLASAQIAFRKIGPGDGDPSGATMAGPTVANTLRPCVNANGDVAFTASTTEDSFNWCLYRNGMLLLESGMPATGTSATFENFGQFVTRQQLNAGGDIIFESRLEGVPAAQDRALHINNTLVVQEGQVAPGIPGRSFSAFDSPALFDDGRVAFLADLNGSTENDGVIYFDGLPHRLNSATPLREGQTIVGGPLDGESFRHAAFPVLNWSRNGHMILYASVDDPATTVNETALIIKLDGSPSYSAPLIDQEPVTVPTGTFLFESIFDVSINSSGDWVASATVAAPNTEDAVVFAGTAGGAPIAIFQEGADASTVTGVPLTRFAGATEVDLNDSGDIVIQCAIEADPTNPIPYDEAVLLYSGGALSLLFTDNVQVDTGIMTDIVNDTLRLAEDGRVIFRANVDGFDKIFEAYVPTVLPVTAVACEHIDGTHDVDITWSNSQAYTATRVFIDGVAQPDLPGTTTSFLATGFPGDTVHRISVVGIDGTESAPEIGCIVAVPAQRDVELCATPDTPILDNSVFTETLTVSDDVSVRDLIVEIRITHPSQFDLDPLSITSPSGTTVILMNFDSGGSNGAIHNVNTYFADFGIPSRTRYSADGFVQPDLGAMGDFDCEVATGDWILTVEDGVIGNEGTLDEWCLRFNAQPQPLLDCCAAPTDLTCTNVEAVLAWTNNDSYFALEIVREDSEGLVTTFDIAPTETQFIDVTAIFGNAYSYTLNFVCANGGVTNEGPRCSLFATPPQPDFLRGDANNDGSVTGINDGLFLLFWATNGGPTPPCFVAGDANGDHNVIGLTDALYLFNWAFSGGAEPPSPFPMCGSAEPDGLGCQVGTCP